MKLGLMLAAGMLAQAERLEAAEPPPPPSAVQASGDASVISYPASFFTEARAVTALDMIQRVPGFAFDEGDDVRGFAGSAGNVLIDGERPTSKAVGLEDLLRRIPATAVVRIDLIRGGAPGIDMQGQALVANIVRSRVTSQTVALTGGARYYTGGGWLTPQADLEWSRRDGDLTIEGAIRYGWTSSPNVGPGQRIRYFPGGATREYGPYFTREREGEFTANGSAQLSQGPNLYRLNAGVSRSDTREYERLDRFSPSGVARGQQLTQERRVQDTLEVGGDYSRTFSERLSGQIIALQTLGKQWSDETSEQPGSLERAEGREKTGESILRAVLTAQPSSALTIEGGAEGAFNFLDTNTAITEDGVPVDIPNAQVRVEERRAEAFAFVTWKPTSKLSVDGRMRLEVSRISQSGDTNLSRSFFFPKPRLLLSYAPDESSQIRLRLEREVGQLQFGDFAANTDFGSGLVSAGGSQLQPERAWVAEIALERRFWGRGAVVLTATHEEVQQVVDRIPLDGFDAPGNIGEGTRDRLEVNFTLPLDRLGVANGLITGVTTLRRSKVTDPVTGRTRRISGENPISGEVNFTQDVAALSSTWGIDFRISEYGATYRINEVRKQSEDSLWSVFWDWKPDPTLSVRAEFRNLNGREQRRWRTRYDGARNLGRVSDVEWQDNRFKPFIYFRVRKVI
jgi:hypothetical protein